MAISAELSRFVRGALTAGRSRDEITEALTRAGWRADAVTEALSGWDERPFSPPVPRPQPTVSARDFFVYTLTFGTLVFGAGYLIAVLHTLIDLAFGDEGYRALGGIRWGLATLIVTVPLFLWLTIRDRMALARDATRVRSAMRKWLIYITLLVAAIVLISDLIAVIYALLSGDLTLQFIFKAAVVVVVAGGVFLYYLADLRRSDLP